MPRATRSPFEILISNKGGFGNLLGRNNIPTKEKSIISYE
jgi:hypothetical protein